MIENINEKMEGSTNVNDGIRSAANTTGAIAKAKETAATQKRKDTSMKDYIKAYEKEFEKALPSVITPERFARIATTALTRTPELAACTPKSFIGALLTAAQLGLEPNTPLGQAYLIPFKNHGTLECQFQIGYKGFIELAHRSGQLRSIEAHIVYENDDFDFEFGLEPKLKHKPALKDRGEMAAVYACYHLLGGGYGFEVMSKADVDAHRRKYSKAGSGPWDTAYEEMAKKTVLKRLLKYAPLKSEFADAVVKDSKLVTLDVAHGETELATEDIVFDAETGEIIE